MKWFQKMLIVLMVILFSPVILFILLVTGVFAWPQWLRSKTEYKKSRYFLDFHVPFSMGVFRSPEYRFYNAAMERNLPIQYVRQAANRLEYFILENVLYVFPDFDRLDYDLLNHWWQGNYDGDYLEFEQGCQRLFAKLDDETPDFPVRILVERKMIPVADLSEVALPEQVFLTLNYETAFETELCPMLLRVPQNTKELYEMMLATPDLCGTFTLVDAATIHWELYENIRITLSVGQKDGYLGIDKKLFGKLESGITHWHPEQFEIYEDVCRIGKRGNVLVIRTILSGASVLYMGDANGCPYSASKKYLFGKLYYLKAE